MIRLSVPLGESGVGDDGRAELTRAALSLRSVRLTALISPRHPCGLRDFRLLAALQLLPSPPSN